MMILGPSVLLMVKMCISRRQNMMKSSESTMRPGYSNAGISLTQGRGRGLSVLLPQPAPATRSSAHAQGWALEVQGASDSWALKCSKLGVTSGDRVSGGVERLFSRKI